MRSTRAALVYTICDGVYSAPGHNVRAVIVDLVHFIGRDPVEYREGGTAHQQDDYRHEQLELCSSMHAQ